MQHRMQWKKLCIAFFSSLHLFTRIKLFWKQPQSMKKSFWKQNYRELYLSGMKFVSFKCCFCCALFYNTLCDCIIYHSDDYAYLCYWRNPSANHINSMQFLQMNHTKKMIDELSGIWINLGQSCSTFVPHNELNVFWKCLDTFSRADYLLIFSTYFHGNRSSLRHQMMADVVICRKILTYNSSHEKFNVQEWLKTSIWGVATFHNKVSHSKCHMLYISNQYWAKRSFLNAQYRHRRVSSFVYGQNITEVNNRWSESFGKIPRTWMLIAQ